MTNKTKIEECTNHEFKVHSGSGITLCSNCGKRESGHKKKAPSQEVNQPQSEIKPIAYFSATKDGKIVWSEDCCCEDPVYPRHDDDDSVSLAVYSESSKQSLQQEIEQLRSEVETLKKVPLFDRATHKIVPINPTYEMVTAWHDSVFNYEDDDENVAKSISNVIASAPEYQERSQWISVEERLQSQAQQTESKPVLKVHNGEICYQSTDDDQCYGMWCPVSYDTVHSYKEGTKFIAIPPAPEGDKK